MGGWPRGSGLCPNWSQILQVLRVARALPTRERPGRGKLPEEVLAWGSQGRVVHGSPSPRSVPAPASSQVGPPSLEKPLSQIKPARGLHLRAALLPLPLFQGHIWTRVPMTGPQMTQARVAIAVAFFPNPTPARPAATR